MNILYKISRIF